MFARKQFTTVVALFVVMFGLLWAMPTTAASDKLPDLVMQRVTKLQTAMVNGKRHLQFSSRIYNKGQGPLEVHGSRPTSSTTEMAVQQRIYDTAGGFRTVSTNTKMMYETNDGHKHWHLKKLAEYWITSVDSKIPLRYSTKQGFCMMDDSAYNLSLPGAPAEPVYLRTECDPVSALNIRMGLSVGYRDIYAMTLTGQAIDISGLAAGKYRLWEQADKGGWFIEANEGNNVTWTDFQLRADGSIAILGYGP